jgi:starch-binding outer membrane protein, SusD/RagB family
MVIKEGTVDVTPRARAFAKFMQGWAWGYLALVFDKAHVVPENVSIPADPDALHSLTINSLVPADSVMSAAIRSLDEAIKIAKASPGVVAYPSFNESSLWFGSDVPISNAKFIQMANTLAARLLVLHARTPAERVSKVNWQKVLEYTAAGLPPGSDFNFLLSSARTSTLLSRMQGNTTTGTQNARWHYRTIGMADQSGAYQAWVAKPVGERDRFNIVTPDRRITGATPTSDGAYARYRTDNNGFEPDRGRYLFSAYQWNRHSIRNGLNATTTGNNTGPMPMISGDENTLLRAEALLRTGDRAGAAAAINVTRTRQQKIGTTTYDGLPPVTASGVPTVNGQCVPKLDSGQCGDLLTAIRYERMIELATYDAIRGYMDSRGFGVLPDGALLNWPVPGNALDLYGLANYTYGGVGQPNTAKYQPATIP